VAAVAKAGLPRASGRAGVRAVCHGRCGVCGWGRAGPGAAAGFYGSTMACGMKRPRQDCSVQRAGGSAVRGGRGDYSGRVRDCGVPRAGLRLAAGHSRVWRRGLRRRRWGLRRAAGLRCAACGIAASSGGVRHEAAAAGLRRAAGGRECGSRRSRRLQRPRAGLRLAAGRSRVWRWGLRRRRWGLRRAAGERSRRLRAAGLRRAACGIAASSGRSRVWWRGLRRAVGGRSRRPQRDCDMVARWWAGVCRREQYTIRS
jgi:hypothetical protein